MTEEYEQRAKAGNHLIGVLIAFLVLVMLYCFSAIPIVWSIYKLTGNVPEPIVKFYAPLEWLYNNNDSVKTTLDAQKKVLGDP